MTKKLEIFLFVIITSILMAGLNSMPSYAEAQTISAQLPDGLAPLKLTLVPGIAPGTVFNENLAGEILLKMPTNTQQSKFKVPAWLAGNWKTTKKSVTYEYSELVSEKDKSSKAHLCENGRNEESFTVPEGDMVIVTNYWTKDKSKDGTNYVWHFFKQNTKNNEPSDQSPISITMKDSSIVFCVDSKSKKVLDIGQSEGIATFKQVGDKLVEIEDCTRVYGLDGKPLVTARKITSQRKIE